MFMLKLSSKNKEWRTVEARFFTVYRFVLRVVNLHQVLLS